MIFRDSPEYNVVGDLFLCQYYCQTSSERIIMCCSSVWLFNKSVTFYSLFLFALLDIQFNFLSCQKENKYYVKTELQGNEPSEMGV
jgi:hypothetical protein